MRRAEFAASLGLDVLGASAVLLLSTRVWQTVAVPRPGLPTLTVDVTGRTLDGAAAALGLAALAAVVAVLAVRGKVRRVVGALLAVVGGAIVWRALGATSAVGGRRARALVEDEQRGAVLGSAVPHVTVHGGWAWATAAGGVLVVAAGALTLVRGHRWQALSSRYDTPARAAEEPAGDLAMWAALERGDDPTA